MLGGITGFRLAELIREDYHDNIPIIFITARDSVDDKLKGFNNGADDYIPKPFSIKEVVARVQAVLSRTEFRKKGEIERLEKEKKKEIENDNKNGILEFSDLVINSETKQLNIRGRNIKLTKKEFEILYMLAAEPQKIFSRTHILDLVWKNEAYVLDRTVDVHIARLRKKLEEYSACIVNRSGYGYCFEIDGKN